MVWGGGGGDQGGFFLSDGSDADQVQVNVDTSEIIAFLTSSGLTFKLSKAFSFSNFPDRIKFLLWSHIVVYRDNSLKFDGQSFTNVVEYFCIAATLLLLLLFFISLTSNGI